MLVHCKINVLITAQHFGISLQIKITRCKLHKFWTSQDGSGCTVLMATGYPYRIKTSKLVNIKFGTGDYIRETTPCAKFGANSSTGTYGQIGEI